ncbi:MAG TPA: SLC13 family permease, partial [Vicinamibacteria bacterium]|nr:SLC13 family permease [Vicinamibacteria bacterium]
MSGTAGEAMMAFSMEPVVLIVFLVVYLGMILGEIPGLALDRTGIALLGAIALVVTGRMGPEAAWRAIDVSTLALLFGLMILSAQFRLGGFYTEVTRRLASWEASPAALLGGVVGVAGLLSAVLANDIVCLAMAPLLIEGCARRRLDPKPFLLALACAANVGSAATLIGNPQNMLIGQSLALSFGGYTLDALVPACLGLVVVWRVVIWRQTKGFGLASDIDLAPLPSPSFDRWQSAKAAAVLFVLVAAFLVTSWPRDVLALGAAGLLLSSRRMASRDMLVLVDWPLLLLFIGLFIVHGALESSGSLAVMMGAVSRTGLDPASTEVLFPLAAVLSNLVSNVPAVMLLLPYIEGSLGGTALALSSTLAGNLFVVGSITNIIVI